MRPVGQAVKTLASHASNAGSSPARVTNMYDCPPLWKAFRYIAGVNDDEDPPVPIPNTEVKLIRVESTWRETAREDRSMPAPFTKDLTKGLLFFYPRVFVESATERELPINFFSWEIGIDKLSYLWYYI